MSEPYIYFAQSRNHPSDPMYAKAFTGTTALYAALEGFEDEYIVFLYTPDGGCKVITL